MAYTNEQLQTLESAIASGTLTVRIGDQWTTFQDLEQLRRLRREMQAELGVNPTAGRRLAKITPVTDKGY